MDQAVLQAVDQASPIFDGRLIKRILMVMPEGAFLHSNICRGDGTPAFAETIGDDASKEEAWQRVRKMRLSGTLFYAYRDVEAYRLDMTMRRRPFI